MIWSPEQVAIFEWYANSTGNLVIEALAGTGKTSTNIEGFSFVNPDVNSILYAVFGKRNQREAEGKIKDPRIAVKTLHSCGLKIVRKFWPNARADNQVEIDRVTYVLSPSNDRELVGLTCKLVSLLKNGYVGIPTQAQAYETADRNLVLVGDQKRDEQIVCAALVVLEKSKTKDPAGRISFDDMVWLPCAMNWVTPEYDLVFVDEAQDMNMPQLSMARQLAKPDGRMVIVGDSRQAIYGFRGAVQNGMNMMKMVLKAQVLSLTTTYRCPKLVVDMAAKYVPAYKSADSAPEGIVESISRSKIDQTIKVGDAILSRLNAPLMPLALSFLRRGVSARIEGRDIGKQLIATIKSLKAVSVPDLLEKLSIWERKQIARLQSAKNAEKKIEVVEDTVQTLQAICQDCETIQDCETKLNGLFQDTDDKSVPAVTLSSVHKAKGLEWDRVFLLSDTFRQAKGGEEENIYYVALTRSKRELYLVGGGSAESVTNGNVPKVDIAPLPAMAPEEVVAQKDTSEETKPSISIGRGRERALSKGPPPRFDSSRVYGSETLLDTTPILPGNRRREVGEVVTILNGKKEPINYVVTGHNPAGAICENVRNKSDTIRISAQCDKSETINFHPPTSEAGGSTNTDNKKEKHNSMKKFDNIESLINHAITGAAKLDDNKITAACLANYPDVPATDAVKLIAKLRKAAAKTGSVPPKSIPQVPKKDKAPKGKSDRQNRLDFIVGLATAGNSQAKMVQLYTKSFGDPGPDNQGWGYMISREWRRANNALGRKQSAGKPAKSLPAKKAVAKATPALPAKKKLPLPPVKKVPAKSVPAKVAPAATEEPALGIPAQGEEVPE
jgi:superfamily I DNA/RNA helicase